MEETPPSIQKPKGGRDLEAHGGVLGGEELEARVLGIQLLSGQVCHWWHWSLVSSIGGDTVIYLASVLKASVPLGSQVSQIEQASVWLLELCDVIPWPPPVSPGISFPS